MTANLTLSSSSRFPDRIQTSNPSLDQVSTPAIRLSTNPSAPKLTGRANESRKLLAHILDQLQRRQKPPPFFEAYSDIQVASNENTLGVFVETVRETMNLRGKQRIQMDATDEENGRVFSTDTTYDLMMQLKNLLIMSDVQQWRIFDDECDQSVLVVLCR